MTNANGRGGSSGRIRWDAVAALLILALAGAAVGYFGYARVFGHSTAVSVLAVATIDGDPVADVDELIEHIKSPEFAAAIAKRSSVSAAGYLLPVYEKASLTARVVRSAVQHSSDLVELRVSAPSSELALKLSSAANDELIAEVEKDSEPILQLQESYIDRLKVLRDGLANVPDEAGLLITQRIALDKAIRDAEAADLPPKTQPTRVIAKPAITTPLLSSPYHTAALGAVAGFLVGLSILQSRRMIT